MESREGRQSDNEKEGDNSPRDLQKDENLNDPEEIKVEAGQSSNQEEIPPVPSAKDQDGGFQPENKESQEIRPEDEPPTAISRKKSMPENISEPIVDQPKEEETKTPAFIDSSPNSPRLIEEEKHPIHQSTNHDLHLAFKTNTDIPQDIGFVPKIQDSNFDFPMTFDINPIKLKQDYQILAAEDKQLYIPNVESENMFVQFYHDIENIMNDLQSKFSQIDIKKSIFCQHNNGCGENAISGFAKNVSIGLVITLGLGIISTIFRHFRKSVNPFDPRLIQNLFKTIFKLSNLRFPLFLGSYAFIYKALICSLRHFLKSNHWSHSFASGSISGLLSIMWTTVSFRKKIHLYILVRAIQTLGAALRKKGYLKGRIWDYADLIGFSGVSVLLLYIFGYGFYAFPPNMLNFFNKFARLKPNEIGMLDGMRAAGLRSFNSRMGN